jgi:hypothetical protein
MTDYTTGVLPLRTVELGTATDHPFVHANVEFGVLQSDGECINIGICRITTTHYNSFSTERPKPRRCPIVAAKLSRGATGRLLAFFPKADMLPCTERAFFSRPVFAVPLPYYLPETVQEALPGLQGQIIAAGLYPIRRNARGYWIEF